MMGIHSVKSGNFLTLFDKKNVFPPLIVNMTLMNTELYGCGFATLGEIPKDGFLCTVKWGNVVTVG